MVILGILSPVTYEFLERIPARYKYTEEHAYTHVNIKHNDSYIALNILTIFTRQ